MSQRQSLIAEINTQVGTPSAPARKNSSGMVHSQQELQNDER